MLEQFIGAVFLFIGKDHCCSSHVSCAYNVQFESRSMCVSSMSMLITGVRSCCSFFWRQAARSLGSGLSSSLPSPRAIVRSLGSGVSSGYRAQHRLRYAFRLLSCAAWAPVVSRPPCAAWAPVRLRFSGIVRSLGSGTPSPANRAQLGLRLCRLSLCRPSCAAWAPVVLSGIARSLGSGTPCLCLDRAQPGLRSICLVPRSWA